MAGAIVKRERKRIMRAHGIDMSNLNAEAVAMAACDELWFLQDVFSRIHGLISASSFVGAVNGLGSNFNSDFSYSNFFSSSRHDGDGAARIAVFNDGCKCYKYSAPPYRV